MKIYLFSDQKFFQQSGLNQKEILHTLNAVAQSTNTRNLVLALYLIRGTHQNRGTAYVRTWMTPDNFLAKRGKWTFARRWGKPSDLPQRFKLIKIRLDGNRRSFPRTEKDNYGWEFRYDTFLDHLATLFAHELHHFRRYHLNLHPREGEHAANRWALRHVQSLGFCVEGKRYPKKHKKRSARYILLKNIPQSDPFFSFRKLKTGAHLIVTNDPHDRYLDQIVTVLRPIRSNSKRIVIQTSDGKSWRWPMEWLRIPDKG